MAPETADRAVDLLRELSADAERVTISFYGGEPLLERPLMSRVLTRARRQAPPSQIVECKTPTNGLLLTPKTIESCGEEGIDFALSIDGTVGPVERRFPNGADPSPLLHERLVALRARKGADVMARMTVTPNNVGCLSENVKALIRLGARTIAYQPALELDWNEAAIAAWQRENERVATFLRGRRALDAVDVDVPALRAIRDRLLGKPRRACGAGVQHLAVATDGRLFPCYRFVFEESSTFELGTVTEGLRNVVALNQLKSLAPDDLRPEDGSCSTCSARDGCTHFCPASGALLAGDLRAVPRVVCALMRAQVAAVRATFADHRRVQATGARGWSAAMLVAASAFSVAASCGGKMNGSGFAADADSGGPLNLADAASDARAATGGTGGTGWVGGVCTGGTTWDAGVGGVCGGVSNWDAGVGGMCTGGTTWDAGADGEGGSTNSWDAGAGGICPAISDAALDAPTAGICPR